MVADKVQATILSCKTPEQLIVAGRMLRMAYRGGHISSEFHTFWSNTVRGRFFQVCSDADDWGIFPAE